MNQVSGILRAVAKFDGSPSKLAKAAGGGVLRQHVEHAIKTGCVPERWAHLIEAAAGIPVEELCPNTQWARIADSSWPHANGRPVVDVARASLAA